VLGPLARRECLATREGLDANVDLWMFRVLDVDLTIQKETVVTAVLTLASPTLL